VGGQRGELRALLDLFSRILLITAVLIGFFFLIDFIDSTYRSIYGWTAEEDRKYEDNMSKWLEGRGGDLFLTLQEEAKLPPAYRWDQRPELPMVHVIGYERFTWAFTWSIYTGILGLYVVAVFFVVQLAKRHERNVVAWTTAAILFTPVLTVIAYLLTWPKDRTGQG
jgi:predicted membrane protein